MIHRRDIFEFQLQLLEIYDIKFPLKQILLCKFVQKKQKKAQKLSAFSVIQYVTADLVWFNTIIKTFDFGCVTQFNKDGELLINNYEYI